MMIMDGFDDCVLGISYGVDVDTRVVYSQRKVIDKLISQGMTEDEAQEYFDFNMLGAYINDPMPVFFEPMPLDVIQDLYSTLGSDD